ncbi:stalk domain-containing protein [Cohnella lupini]|uniref:Copper amine oxidase-like protein n=1 Tax=Cohnella lupini TaxID=1294267 RepID=A0A3D9I009_9BACL|nr:stalk domain-containing protein [Cohnella lupini]RED55108.1 copper amine oxidase-like protein [Cohnella lupini]
MNKTMKTVAVSLVAAAIMIPGFASAADMMTKVDYSKFNVVQKNGESWVPLRQIAQSLGYSVHWSKMDGIMLTKKMMDEMMPEKDMMDDMDMKNDMDTMGDMDKIPKMYSIVIKPGQKEFMIGMDKMMMMKAPMLIKNTTYVSKEFVETYLLNSMMSK